MTNGDTRPGRAIEEIKRWSSIVLLVLVVVLGYYVSNLTGSVEHIDDTVDRVEQSSTRTEASARELVEFVHEIQAQQTPCATTTTNETTTTDCQPSSTSQTQQAVQLIIDVLCSSSDPVRVEACSTLKSGGGG